MIQAASGILIAYLITFFLLPFIIRIAQVNKIFDIPDERKTHINPISSLGGIAIFAGLVISLLLVADFKGNNAQFQYYLAAFFVIFVLGVIDDVFILKAWKKILGQLIVTGILIWKAGLLITNFQGFLGIYELSSTASHLVTFFSIILLINAFNLIDGVDGLAASLGLLVSVLFGVFFLVNNQSAYGTLGFTMGGALLAFLIYNFPPARIFMGDSGSTLIGLVAAIMSIRFLETASSVVVYPIETPAAMAFGFLLIPLMDVLRVFVIRLVNKRSPIAPDRNHLHHLLQTKGFSHTGVTVSLLLCSLFIASISFVLQGLDIHFIIGLQFLIYFGGVGALVYLVPDQQFLHVVPVDQYVEDDSKVYPIYPAKEKVSVADE
jgi:UDP-N-acetylmuramyl pentapeptide phosphotransferase/UDP-N-acetylglucosamine-1-phosphate transferase